MDYYWNGRTDPAFNLALEEIMTAQADAPFVMLWRNRPAVIIGRNQNAYVELDAAYTRENGIAVVRRMTGGGAVYHDLGNLNYSFFSFEADSDTVGGWCCELLEKFPEPGEELFYECEEPLPGEAPFLLQITVLSMDGLRVERIRVNKVPLPEE